MTLPRRSSIPSIHANAQGARARGLEFSLTPETRAPAHLHTPTPFPSNVPFSSPTILHLPPLLTDQPPASAPPPSPPPPSLPSPLLPPLLSYSSVLLFLSPLSPSLLPSVSQTSTAPPSPPPRHHHSRQLALNLSLPLTHPFHLGRHSNSRRRSSAITATVDGGANSDSVALLPNSLSIPSSLLPPGSYATYTFLMSDRGKAIASASKKRKRSKTPTPPPSANYARNPLNEEEKENQLLPSTDPTKFPNLYCELRLSRTWDGLTSRGSWNFTAISSDRAWIQYS
ncbi:WAS/WASL-interacting protein family member 3-like [Arachis ipaensis]|uniref:WAS/WASL-interacting protein family member 3-like n=1 Tax=Arachis ipaensis TaxID=130454 RepID=UPI0007AF7235|nr:WAS/WASL-interacting protein family member 3-like [Arachis ipaensis]